MENYYYLHFYTNMKRRKEVTTTCTELYTKSEVCPKTYRIGATLLGAEEACGGDGGGVEKGEGGGEGTRDVGVATPGIEEHCFALTLECLTSIILLRPSPTCSANDGTVKAPPSLVTRLSGP